MTVTIELPPEIEENLAAQAAAQGISLRQYLRHLLEEQVPSRRGASLTPAQRAALWRESVMGLPRTPPLPDRAIDRDAIYDVRG
jgi:hypothetical protein